MTLLFKFTFEATLRHTGFLDDVLCVLAAGGMFSSSEILSFAEEGEVNMDL